MTYHIKREPKFCVGCGAALKIYIKTYDVHGYDMFSGDKNPPTHGTFLVCSVKEQKHPGFLVVELYGGDVVWNSWDF